MFLTCCASHNFLLELDGLDQKCEDGIDCDWFANPNRKGDYNDDKVLFDDVEFDGGGDDSIATNRNSDHANSDKNDNYQSLYVEHRGNEDFKNDDRAAVAVPTSISTVGPIQVVYNLSLNEIR